MMVMKKIWKMMAMTLVMGMTVSMAAGCGNQGSTPQEPANDQKQAEQQAQRRGDAPHRHLRTFLNQAITSLKNPAFSSS